MFKYIIHFRKDINGKWNGGESLFNEAKQCLIDKMQPSLQETGQLLLQV